MPPIVYEILQVAYARDCLSVVVPRASRPDKMWHNDAAAPGQRRNTHSMEVETHKAADQ